MKKIGIGYENYKDFIDKDMYYIDKTLLIRDVVEKGGQTTLFTRPRRFGKTLAISMIRTFFEMEMTRDGQVVDNSHYFVGKKIMEADDKILSMMGQYPVINLSLKGAKSDSFFNAFYALRSEIREELGLKEDKRKSINIIKEPWMHRISGKRQTGRTTELIKLCQKMNRDHCINDTVIVVADQKRAQCVSEMANKLGYTDMPVPIPIHYATSQHMAGSYYKWALIDDIEYVLQTILGNGGLQLRGYVEED